MAFSVNLADTQNEQAFRANSTKNSVYSAYRNEVDAQ